MLSPLVPVAFLVKQKQCPHRARYRGTLGRITNVYLHMGHLEFHNVRAAWAGSPVWRATAGPFSIGLGTGLTVTYIC